MEQTINLNGVTYRAEVASEELPVRIVILQRGWVMVGRFSADGDALMLTSASVVHHWGTTKGLGQIVAAGPTKDTILHAAGTVRFHALTVVAMLDCEGEAWAPHL